MNTGKVVFLEMHLANAERPFSMVASPGVLSNLLVDNTSKTNMCAQRKETLSELVGPLVNVRWKNKAFKQQFSKVTHVLDSWHCYGLC
jgi:hypothetical protein